jgi:hypothetical protein
MSDRSSLKGARKAHAVGSGTNAHPWAFLLLEQCRQAGIDLIAVLKGAHRADRQ